MVSQLMAGEWDGDRDAWREEEDEPVAGTRVLGQVLGREQIFVLLEIDVLLFKPKTSEEGEGS